MAPHAFAQQQPPGRPQAAPLPAAKAAPGPAREAAPAGDGALRQRIEQLEEQLVDMQVVIGTLESLARGATAPAPAGGGRPGPGPSAAIGAADAGRLDSIETQIRALAAQLEQMQEQMRALPGRSGALPPVGAQASSDPGPAPRPGRPQIDNPPPQPERTGFGSVTVSPDAPKDEIDRILNPPSQPGAAPGPGPQVAAAPAPASPGEAEQNPKQLYEAAYGYLLQRDYGAAEAAFDEFLRRHPNDPLAGNAQYWLGESLYVRGPVPSRRGRLPQGLPDLRQEREGAGEPPEARHVAAAARPEGRGLLLVRRADHQVPERTRAREEHGPDRTPARRLPVGAPRRLKAGWRSRRDCRRGPCPRSASGRRPT